MIEPDTSRAVVEIEGPRSAVDTVVTLLRFIQACGAHGTTRWVDLMIDGDGGAQLAVRIDGQTRPLDEAESVFLMDGAGEVPVALQAQCITTEQTADGTLVKIEIV